MDRLGYASPTSLAPAIRLEHGSASVTEETLAEETPVTFVYNGVSHAVMMATPSDLEDFATGFSITEGLVGDGAAISSIAVVRYAKGIELQIDTTAEVATEARRRRLSGRSGCGICGMADVEQVLRTLPRVESATRFASHAVSLAMRELADAQPLNRATGAVHAAGWASVDGAVHIVREDVGRHNALDKLIGVLVRGGIDPATGFVVLTSRGSFELVQKVAVFGAALVAAVSAPTGLAVRMAEQAGITLAGFARADRVTVYTHPARISP
ncbi:MAG: formate dehydrogenase accessory sulfurtransferase FdhD [bacterium]